MNVEKEHCSYHAMQTKNTHKEVCIIGLIHVKGKCLLYWNFDNKRVDSESNENLLFKCKILNVRENQRYLALVFFISCRKNPNYIENQCYWVDY